MGGSESVVERPVVKVKAMRVKKKLSPAEGRRKREKEEDPEEEAPTIVPRVVHQAKE